MSDGQDFEEEVAEVEEPFIDDNEALPEEEEALPEEEEPLPDDEALDDNPIEDVPEDEELPDEDAAEEAVEEEPAPEDDMAEVEDHLKDAVEGSIRLKRMLSRDKNDGNAAKVRKVDASETFSSLSPQLLATAKQLQAQWELTADSAVKHALENLNEQEITHLVTTRWCPPIGDVRRTPAEWVAGKAIEFRERSLPPGAHVDIVSSFKFRWKCTVEQERQLRALVHKDLRYVVEKHDGSLALEDFINEASAEVPEDVDSAANAAPDSPGPLTMGRFNRLELIDPMADSAVFGDANLTFALLLAKHRKEMGHVGRVIATTFEEIETLRERYKEIDESIKILEDDDAEVYHGVDCTRIAIDSRFKGMEGQLGAVYYNFPHSGAIQGFFDSHPMVNWRHENLMRLFFRALRTFVKVGGSVKVSSSKGAVGVRFSYIVGSAIENEFQHVETMPFLEWKLHRYGRSYGDRRDLYKRPDAKNNQSYAAQAAHNDMVYCFEYRPTGQTLGKQQIRMPPTLNDLSLCRDGPFTNMQGAAKLQYAKKLHERFVTEVTGTHVG